MNELNELVSGLRAFRDERNWLKFHSPKNLSMALAQKMESCFLSRGGCQGVMRVTVLEP